MVAVQVRQYDAVNGVRIEIGLLESHQRRRAEIDHQIGLRRREPETGVHAPARTEGVAATDNGEFHRFLRPLRWVAPRRRRASAAHGPYRRVARSATAFCCRLLCAWFCWLWCCVSR